MTINVVTSTMILVMMVIIVPGTVSDVFSSMMKMERLARFERVLIKWFAQNTNVERTPLKRFMQSRVQTLKQYGDGDMHPNTGYILIKTFLTDWRNVLEQMRHVAAISNAARQTSVEIPNRDDLTGAVTAILLLQRMYNISTEDVQLGNFSGFEGPALSFEYLSDLGIQAFNFGMLDMCASWLQLALQEMDNLDSLSQQTANTMKQHKGKLLSVLGQIYLQRGDVNKAREMFAKAFALGTSSEQMTVLEEQLKNPLKHMNISKNNQSFLPERVRQQCCRDRANTVGRQRHFHTCRYKPSLLLPYLQYKEEILSIHPYVTVFYDVISDSEIDTLKEDNVKLKRAKVGQSHGRTYEGRTGQLKWLSDKDSDVAARLSRRISDITWLNVRDPQGQPHHRKRTAEPLQVLNYGLGGHYTVHLDTVGIEANESNADEHNENGKDKSCGYGKHDYRLATFMIYLSDTDIGGHTIFPELNISIAPVKGKAVFWYNVKPSGMSEEKTMHAGCPVLKGNKWIANKWIYSNANMFRRPCALTPKASHLEMEPLMYNRGRHTLLTS